ncbi:hypothetical protein GGI25_004364 [Coemansia spiralis]|uniref:FAD/NAD(P)-binding domain-containing protein n=2 Tax=Coemansia TaxID=4863 RepID=A0A9W8G6C6_9FUNG|nr:hypothetical protein BX070DRAFT_236603 [Coemansia spiralis]KAJ1992047.1 hypothetical protein EDC05_003038 [Coemansia umbellata]KAJ2621450.1 hypothetical protein GGI26_004132 [Coemansia sp. RSA 1358]KAJ2674424.1 hypothetical protein GGI25_004364 [Coemansia spiralis]
MSSRDIHVVVVGISTAGVKISKALAALGKADYPNLHITMVDKNAYYFHAIGAPLAIVNPAYGKSILFPLKDLLQSYETDPQTPKHKFIHASLASVDKTSVVLSNGETLSFDYLVLATGAANKTPANIFESSVEKAQAQLYKVYENIKSATNILIIGGGAVGVEMAGEIASAYPGKPITLVHSADRLLPLHFKRGISNGAVYKLEKLGVKVVLNEKIDIPKDTMFDCTVRKLSFRGSSGAVYESDLQILATGTQLHTEYMETLESKYGATLREPNGAIKVMSTLQLADDRFQNIFVPGDVNNQPAGAKYAFIAAEQGQLVADNLITMIKGGFDKDKPVFKVALKEWSGKLMESIVVPIGRSMGVAQIFGIAMGKSAFPDILVRNVKSKDYFRSHAATSFS